MRSESRMVCNDVSKMLQQLKRQVEATATYSADYLAWKPADQGIDKQ